MTPEMMGWLTIVGTNIATSVGIYKYFNGRLARVYERLDEVKQGQENTYVRKDVCGVMHKETANNLIGSEVRLTARLDKLENKFDQIIDLITSRVGVK
jgi:hypothetical protein